MTLPGTPAIVLSSFVAPAFAAASVAMGAVVTSVTFENAAAGEPFTFGQPFKQGDLAPTDGLDGRAGAVAISLQVDIKATHPDGSVRHAIISGRTPGSVKMDLVRAPLTPAAAFVPPVADAVVVLTIAGVEYTAAPSGKPIVWLSGPVTTEHIYNVPFVAGGVPNPHLTAQFAVRSYEGNAKIDVTVEHTKAYAAATDITYDARVIIGGEQRYVHAGLVHFPGARWKKTIWTGAAPALHIKHDTQYLVATKQVPHFDPRVRVVEVKLAEFATKLATKNFGPMGFGVFAPAMGTTGGRPEIALMPDSYAAALMSMDRRAHDMMMASADAAGSWGAHLRDCSTGPASGRPLDVLHWPYATIEGGPRYANNPSTGQNEYLAPPATSSIGRADVSHQAAFAYLPYLLTGDFYYLEELHFWNGFNQYIANFGYRGYHRGWVKQYQVRGQAWCLRTLAEAAYITPDIHPSKAALHYWLDENVNFYLSRYVDKRIRADGMPLPTVPTLADAVSEMGALTDGYGLVYPLPLPGVTTPDASVGLAPWMDDFFTQALGHVVDLGHAGAARLMQWKAKFVVQRVNGDGACFVDAPIYALRMRDSATSAMYTTIRECYAKTLGDVAAMQCNSPERLIAANTLLKASRVLGEMTGYAYSNSGFGANMQPALAYAVDAGIPGAAEAWAKYESRSIKQNYEFGPQFAIVPRSLSVVVPPVAAPGPVPPVPTPPATVVPAPSPVTPAPAAPIAAGGTVSIKSARLVPGRAYAVFAQTDSGQFVAIEFPVIAK